MLNKESNLICIAKIGRAHGIKGMVYITLYTETPEFLLSENEIYDKKGNVFLKIEELIPHKNGYRATIEGIETRNDAESLCHKELYMSRDLLPDIEEEDDFYFIDLIGMEVFLSGNPEKFGEVSKVENFGASDLLEIKRDDDGELFFIPFTKAYVPEVNKQEKRITLSLPENFFDTPKQEDILI